MESLSVVIDNGSGCTKVGLSGDEAPRSKFPTIVGKPRLPSIMVGMDQKEAYVGQEAEEKKGVLFLRRPIVHGVVDNWNDMTKVWHYSYYNELRVTPEEHPCLLTETSLNPKTSREKMTQILFETFNVPSLYVAVQAVLALYSSGRTTGLVLDSGDGVTTTVPIFEGYALPHAIERNNFAGEAVTHRLHELLGAAGLKFSLSSEGEVIESMKEKLCYVAQDYEAELREATISSDKTAEFTLPDGALISLNEQRFGAPEAMFSSAVAKETPTLPEMLFQSIMKCDLDVRKELESNVVLSGGNTMFSGMPERIAQELTRLLPANAPSDVIALPNRQFLPWIGGSILSSLTTFQAMWISKNEFLDSGETIIHRKCF